jgi:hypothetical protein
MEYDDLVRGPAARRIIIEMRDKEKGVAREVLTLSLARGYLKTRNLKAARAEAESVPASSLDRLVLLRQIEDAEKAAARRNE